MRLFFVSFFFLASCVIAFFGYPLVHKNHDAIIFMVTVITVFAGFLVAIIAILGDPNMIPSGSWRKAEFTHKKLESSLIRNSYIFYSYLVSIAFLFVGILIEKECPGNATSKLESVVEFLCVLFSSFSFMLTLSLPKALYDIQMTRCEAEIESRRASEGIGSSKIDH